jgi:hypothetical protein
VDWKDIGGKILQALIVAALLWVGGAVKDLVMEVHDLRYDVDRLYAEVSELAEKE